MAANFTLATFAILVIVMLVTITALILLIIQIVDPAILTSTSTSTMMMMTGGPTATTTLASMTSELNSSHQRVFGSGKHKDVNLLNSPNVITLSGDVYYTDLTLDNTTMNTNGFRIFVSGTARLLNGSVIRHSGGDGAANNVPAPVPGGTATVAGTLGCGGRAGVGSWLSNKNETGGAICDMNGGGSYNVLYEVGGDTSLFAGMSATVSSETVDVGVGRAGRVAHNPSRAQQELLLALDPTFVPLTPLLSGGSGGGGGNSRSRVPGSGGGAGGGVVVLSAYKLEVPENGGTIDVSGGNGGPLMSNGPSRSTSGGGGGGGLIVINTHSPCIAFKGLTLKYNGGSSIDAQGETMYASPGRVIFWNDHIQQLEEEKDQANKLCTKYHNTNNNIQQYINVTNGGSQIIFDGQEAAVKYNNQNYAQGLSYSVATHQFIVAKSGLYLIDATISFIISTPDSFGYVWIKKNAETVKYGPTDFHYKPSPVSHNVFTRINTTISLETNDTFELRIWQKSGAQLIINPSLDCASTLNATLIQTIRS